MFGSFEVDDVSAFLPPGFKPGSNAPPPPHSHSHGDGNDHDHGPPPDTTEKPRRNEDWKPSGTTEKQEFKLNLSKLFEDLGSEDVNSALLPPGFDPNAASTTTTEKITLKFPSRPGKKAGEKPKPTTRRPVSGPPPFVPKIKSFAER